MIYTIHSYLNVFYKKAGFLLLFIVLSAHPGWSQSFTIPIFPDTQTEIRHSPDMFYSQINWIKDKQDSLHIPIALHVGDIVDRDIYSEWEIAGDGFSILDRAHVPYALAAGNHDNFAKDTREISKPKQERIGSTNAKIRMTEKFNSYFPVWRFPLQRGRFEEGKSDNAYYTFTAGGVNWLVMVLEYGPRMDVIHWAGQVIDDYPHHNVILLTHYFLREGEEGGIIGEDTNFGANRSPQELNTLLVEKHSNILLVISGHTNESAWRIGEGENGNKIYQILQDYQSHEFDYGGGFLRLLSINPEAGTISGKMYSPYFDKTKGQDTEFLFSEVEFISPLE